MNTHLGRCSFYERPNQIKTVLQDLKKNKTPIIVAGDFNEPALAPSSAGQQTRGALLSQLNALGLRDSWLTLKKTDQGFTHNTTTPFERIDWILASKEFTPMSITKVPLILSDHFAVVAQFQWIHDQFKQKPTH